MASSSRHLQRVLAAVISAVLGLGLVGLVGIGAATSAQGQNPGAVPMVVPPATGNNAVITVRVGGDRQGTTGVSALAGTTLQLYDGTTAPTAPVAEAWATCTSDADGDCSFVVPDTQPGQFGCFSLTAGANCDRRFWIVQTGVPAGFTANATFRTGNGDGTGSQLTPYQFRTGSTLRAGNTYSSNQNFMIGTGSTNRSASGGIWQQSRTNPVPLQQCGLRVALILDLSGSVNPSQLVELKAAASTFTDSLVGTPSEMALFSFSTGTPAEGATQNYPGLTSVSTQAAADAFKSRYAAWTSGGGTNWDRALATTAEAAADYDIAVVVTDGNPTFYSQPAEGPGNFTRIREMENGVFSANAVKAQGTRVLAVGAGAGVSDTATAQNLAAISGPTAYDGTNALAADYYQVSDYTVVGQALRQLALGECAGSLSVVKQLVDASGSVADATLAGAGWTFDASTTSSGVTLGTTSATTDASSAVNFPITYAAGTTAGTVEVQEQTQAGTALFPVDGANAVCTNLDTGGTVPVLNADPAGFTVDVSSTAAISCTVYNQVAEPATVTVDKEWVIDGAAPVPNGAQPSGFSSQLTLTGPGGAGATNQAWHVPRAGYVAGDEVSIAEIITLQAPDIDPDLCVVSAAEIVTINGAPVTPVPVPDAGYDVELAAGDNTYTVRNTVDCESRLTLAKEVEGAADPALWTLSALPAPGAPAGQLPGPSGQAGSAAVTDQSVTPGVAYQLAESGGPPTYLQVDERTDLQVYPLSTGTWTCIRVDANGNQVGGFNDGLNGGVTPPIAARVLCTATNQTAQLSLAKDVINEAGGSATPADFTLRATPSGTPPVAGLTEVVVPGAAPGTAQPVEIRPDHTYTLSETGPAGFSQTSLECTVDGVPQEVTEIAVGRGESVECIFVNIDDPAEITLRKVVDPGTTGATQTPADWTLTASPQGTSEQEPVSGNGADGVTAVEVAAGDYALTESDVPGFDAGTWACVDAGGTEVPVDDSVVTLANGAQVTCTIENVAQQPTLTLEKVVLNDQGGTAEVGDWTLAADGPTPGRTGATGDPAVTDAPVAIGSYTLSETGPPGYLAGAWTCAADGADLPVEGGVVVIGLGQEVTCTIQNDDQPATLTLVKEVVNDHGGTAAAADWTLTADGPTAGVSGPSGSAAVTGVPVAAGEYDLTETGGPQGYVESAWACTGGTLTDATIAVTNGADVVCTITNTFDAPLLTLVKDVLNDEGGTAVPEDWTLAAQGPEPFSGITGSPAVTAVAVAPGSYTLSETGPEGYTSTGWLCEDDSGPVALDGAVLVVAPGDDVTCTVTNIDTPTPQDSTWTADKTSDPPSGTLVGPGEIITYTVRAGIVSGDGVEGVEIVDDLSRVLDKAELVEGSIDPSAGTATLTGTQITWSLPTLVGTQTVTYQVRVADRTTGETLRNVVTAPGALPCPPVGPTFGTFAVPVNDCRTTTHRTPAPTPSGLSLTGAPTLWLALGAFALTAAGTAVAWGTRRRDDGSETDQDLLPGR